MEEITDTILDFWFGVRNHDDDRSNSNCDDDCMCAWWFNGSRDSEIYEKFAPILTRFETKVFETKVFDSGKYKYRTAIATIILFDQITRNVLRVNPTLLRQETITAFFNVAASYATYYITKDIDIHSRITHAIFIWLPLRHTLKRAHLDTVIGRIKLYASTSNRFPTNTATITILKKFLLASLQAYTHNTENIVYIDNSPRNTDLCNPTFTYDAAIHDEICTYTDVQLQSSYDWSDHLHNHTYTEILKYVTKYHMRTIGVSLSGGVDSMVLLVILRQMLSFNHIDTVVAIHINYNFREESTTEATFLIDFCKTINVPIIYTPITHFINIERDTGCTIEREFYEEETKKIRFNTYKEAIAKYNLTGICLGHHRDDLVENVFMNMVKGNDILNLFGMTDYAIMDGVPIARPMLTLHKADIYHIAHAVKIPYFKDTTPDWSFRGTMRRQIFPILNKFGNIADGLYTTGTRANDCNTLLETMLNQNIERHPHGFAVQHAALQNQNTLFWNKILAKEFNARNAKMTTRKSIDKFIIWYNSKTSQQTIFNFSNNYSAITNDAKLYVIESSIITSTTDNTRWLISLSEDVSDVSNIHRQMTYDDVLRGHYEYAVTGYGDINDVIISCNNVQKSGGGYINMFAQVNLIKVPRAGFCKSKCPPQPSAQKTTIKVTMHVN